MEYVDGVNLQDRVARNGWLDVTLPVVPTTSGRRPRDWSTPISRA